MRFPGEGVEEVREEYRVEVPGEVRLGEGAGRGGIQRELVEEYGEAPDREPAAPEVREVDAVEALEVSLYRVGVLAE